MWYVYYQTYDTTHSFTGDFIPEGTICYLLLHRADIFVFEKPTFHNHKSFERVPFNTQTNFGVTPCLVIREYGEALTHLFTRYFILLRSQNFCISLFDGLRCKTVHTMLLPKSFEKLQNVFSYTPMTF